MLENRKRSLAGFRMAGKYLAIIQPVSALLANPKFRSEHSMHAYMQPSLDLLRGWESRLGMEDIALVIRSCIALLESIKTYSHAARISPIGITNSQNWPTSGRTACLHPHCQSQGYHRAAFQGCIAPHRIATSSPTAAIQRHANWLMFESWSINAWAFASIFLEKAALHNKSQSVLSIETY